MKKLLAYVFIFGLWPFVPAQDWQALPSFPGVARDDAAGFVIGNDLYIGSGLS